MRERGACRFGRSRKEDKAVTPSKLFYLFLFFGFLCSDLGKSNSLKIRPGAKHIHECVDIAKFFELTRSTCLNHGE